MTGPVPAAGRLLPLQPEGSRPPLYCVHPASGSAYGYVALARMLGADQPVYAFEAPGFDDDEPPVASIPELAARYAAELPPSTGPVALLGWSLGGAVAFELARLLQRRGQPVRSLLLLDAAVPRYTSTPDERDMVRRFLHDLTGAALPPMPELDAVLAAAPAVAAPPEAVPTVAVPALAFAAVRRAAILPEEADLDFLLHRYAVFRAHATALHRHEPSGRYPGGTTLIRAASTPLSDLDWTPWISGLDHHTVPATHTGLLSGEALPQVADIVRRCLRDAAPVGSADAAGAG